MSITERIDAITKVTSEYWGTSLPAPKSVKIELTGRCNFRCSFCALRERAEQPKEDMDFDLFKRITREMRDAGVEEIGVFYLGESFMNPTLLVDAITYLKLGIDMPYVFLTSNASLATPALVKRCMEAGLDSLKWSVNAGDEHQFAEIMGVAPKNFYSAIKNIQLAKQIRDVGGHKCGLYASSIKYDGEQQAKMEKFLETNIIPYVDQHYWLPLYSMGSVATKREAELGYRPTAGNQGRLDAMRDPLPCWSIMTEGHVRADGHLSACCFGADARFDVGDLTAQSFMEAWNSPELQAIRAAHLKAAKEGVSALKGTMCEDCIAYQG